MESRRTILLAAANLATTRGLEGLSIGELAQHIGMSKSGLYAHFKSKEELELATIETAAEIFERDVLGPAGESPGGLGRVLALSEAFLGHLERRVFPGGCFFATVSVQLASRPGRPRDRVMELQQRWLEQFAEALGQAVAGGELPRDTDIDQLVFEITAMLVRANFTWVVTGDDACWSRPGSASATSSTGLPARPRAMAGRPAGGRAAVRSPVRRPEAVGAISSQLAVRCRGEDWPARIRPVGEKPHKRRIPTKRGKKT